VPVGVAPSPSRFDDDSPLRPTRACHGPTTRRQHAPCRVQSESVAYVEPRAAWTVTSCVEPCVPEKQATAERIAATVVTRPWLQHFRRMSRPSST
jgi:hypothetical protein